ncbi:MAG: ATP-binding protein, partial [Nitrososphaera sp.]
MAKKLQFKISTGLKNIIGKELITDDFVAIFELVKNSYDAKAKKVTIEFHDIKKGSEKSRISIIDDGDGMSYDDLINRWLFVGYSAKKEDPDKQQEDYRDRIEKKKRVFAGAKGIGRFSVDRLGGKLKLYTKKTEASTIHQLDINWNQFEKNQEKEFQQIKTIYSTSHHWPKDYPELSGRKKGTVLEISGLNEEWDGKKLLKLRRTLQRMINPSLDPDSKDFQIELVAKEFEIEDSGKRKKGKEYEVINGPIKNLVFEKLKIKTIQIVCEIRDDKITTTLTDKGRWIFELREENPYHKLRDARIFIFFLNEESKADFKRIMGLRTVEYGSIFRYKNGFRVYPYGEPGDDWLGLERRKGQGVYRNLAAREVIGRIEVYGSQADFRETSSREGVTETEEVKQL